MSYAMQIQPAVDCQLLATLAGIHRLLAFVHTTRLTGAER